MRPAVRKRWCSTFRFHATWKIWSRIILCIYLKFSSLSRICWTELHCSDLRCHTWLNIPCQYLEFVIISDRKVISSQLLLSLSVLGSIFNHFLNSNNFVYIRTGRFFSRCLDCTFKSTRKLNREISYSLDKSTISINWRLCNQKSTIWAGCGFRAWIETFELIDYIMYLLGQHTTKDKNSLFESGSSKG